MIAPQTISQQILKQLHDNSPQDYRSYLGMSGIGQCALKQYRRLLEGPDESDRMVQYAYTGYLHESDLKRRLVALGLARVVDEQAGIDERGIYRCGSERSLVAPWDNRFQGHTDGETADGNLLELKSINDKGFKELDYRNRPKDEHVAQVQTYMRYGKYRECLIVYVNRDTFEHCAFNVAYDPQLADALDAKARLILKAIDRQQPPACTCGWCK